MHEFAVWLRDTPLSVFLQSVNWIVPTVQTIHIVTVGIVFISILMIALRVLGVARGDQPFGDVLRRFTPFVQWGLVVMAATGLTLVLAEPVREFYASSFWTKMALLAVAVGSGFLFIRTLSPAKLAGVASASEFSDATKLAACATIAVWLAIIFFGRAIAYDVEVWGGWSLTHLNQT
jgi:hypothetical protein